MQILYNTIILPIEYLIEFLFVFSSKQVHSAGIAIIIVSLTINFLVLPIYRSADSIQEQERLKQEKMSRWIKHIKNAFSGDERFMIMNAYYHEEHYHPLYALRSVFSLLLQIPFFIAAYHFLSTRSGLDGVSFLYLNDLGQPDGLIRIRGISINLLPILMTFFNIISGVLYMRHFPLKSKIQHYLLTLFFFILLYQSPSGLVFYWTLNNLFSLLKNIFMKYIKRPRETFNILILSLGLAAFIFLMLPQNRQNKTDILYAAGILFICSLPLFSTLITICLSKNEKNISLLTWHSSLQIPLVLITLLWGILIPLSVISSSPGEFVDVLNYRNPLHYVFDTLCISAGIFLFWGNIFGYLMSKKGRNIAAAALWICYGTFITDYMFFGKKLGRISSQLEFDEIVNYDAKSILINLAVILIVMLILLYIGTAHPRIHHSIVIAVFVATSFLSAQGIVSTQRSLSNMAYLKEASETPDFSIPISRNGKNVVIFTLDRAMSVYLPFILYERPELAEEYSGFTYYPNTISYGPQTTTGAKAMLGGYEYIPTKVLERTGVVHTPEVQDESLKVLPVLFADEGYSVEICDPPLAGDQVVSDISIFDDCEGVKAYQLMGHYNPPMIGNEERLRHHFFFYSIFKSVPLAFQKDVYSGGTYCYAEENGTFTRQNFLNAYGVLKNLIQLTEINDTDTNTLLIMNNDTAHDSARLQLPDYEPALVVDNTGLENWERTNAEGRVISIEGINPLYHGNMAALLKIADWLNYLKEQGCYDNTRIIIVSDHGCDPGSFPEFDIDGNSAHYNIAMLMIKDFDSTGEIKTSYEFMTNADTPTLATEGLIDNPINPFTGERINEDQKSAPYQTIIGADCCFTIHDNIFDKNNWTIIDPIAEETIFDWPQQ